MEPTLWRYSFPNQNHEGWAVFLLDSCGMLAVTSDFGNYAFHWPRNGWGPGDFRSFLADVNASYLISKLSLGHDQQVYPEETGRSIREAILRWRKTGSLTKEQARTELELLKRSDFDTILGCHEWYLSTSLADAHEFIHYGPPPQLVAFAEKVWPRFVEALKRDLEPGQGGNVS